MARVLVLLVFQLVISAIIKNFGWIKWYAMEERIQYKNANIMNGEIMTVVGLQNVFNCFVKDMVQLTMRLI